MYIPAPTHLLDRHRLGVRWEDAAAERGVQPQPRRPRAGPRNERQLAHGLPKGVATLHATTLALLLP